MWRGEVWRKLRYVARRHQFERDLQEEIQLHLELRARDSQNPDAPYAAIRQFGNITRVKEQSREAWSVATFLGTLLQDARFSLRSFAKARGFTFMAALMLALG